MVKVKNVFDEAKTERFKKGSVIIEPKDKPQDIYYLSKGKVKQYVIDKNGEEIVIHIFSRGTFFPIMLTLGNIRNRFYFKALTNVQTKVLPAKVVVEFLKKDNLFLFDLTRRFSKAINGLVLRIEQLLGSAAANKVASLLIYLSKKFGHESTEGTKINLSLTHREIANWVGLERETVSRLMKKFEESGFITYSKRKITIIDLKKLRNLSK